MEYTSKIPELTPLIENADYVDVKCADGNVRLDEFIASLFSFPGWVKWFFYIRGLLAAVLRLKHENISNSPLQPGDIPMEAGGKIRSFTVRMVQKDSYWIAESPEDKHLRAYLAILAEPLDNGSTRFRVKTIVHYKSRAGPVYFSIIRPFHHIIVYLLTKRGVKRKQ